MLTKVYWPPSYLRDILENKILHCWPSWQERKQNRWNGLYTGTYSWKLHCSYRAWSTDSYWKTSLWRWCPHQWASVFCSVGYDDWTKWLLSLSGCCTQAWRTAPNDNFFIGMHAWRAAELFFSLKLIHSYFSMI